MATVSELVFKASYSDLEKAKGVMGELATETEKAQKEAEKLESTISMAGKAGAAFGAALVGGVAALIAFTKSSIDYADSINETSQKINVSTEALSGWAYGAKMAGVGQEDLTSALIKLNKQMDEAYTGNKAATEMFERLGVSVTDINGNVRDTESVFYDVADAFSKTEDNASKTAVAMEMFGKSAGPALVPFLSQGREGLEKLNMEALKFGLIISKEVGEQADAFNDRLDQMRGVIKGAGTQIAAGLLPTLNHLGEMLTETAQDGTKMAEVTQFLDNMLKGLASTGVIVTTAFQAVGKALGAIAAAVVAAAHGEFAQAKSILSEGWNDVKITVSEGVKTVEKVWDEAAAKAETNAPKRLKALGIPDVKETKDKIKKEVDELKSIVEEIQRLADPTKVWNDKITDADKALKANRITVEEHAAALHKYGEEIAKIVMAETAEEKKLREINEAEKKRLEYYENLGNPLKKYTDQLIEIDNLMEKYKEYPAIMEQLSAAQAKVVENIGKATKETKNTQDDLMKSLLQAAEGYGQKMSSSFVDWMSGAKTSFSDMVRSMITDIAKLIMYQAVFKPMVGGLMGMMGFKDGGAFDGGSPMPFADGMVSSPTLFPMANGGTGLAGESGTEAIMPLRRDANGRLGVTAAQGGSSFQVEAININISGASAKDAPAVGEAARSGIDRALRGMVQSEIFNQTRLGNGLNPLPLTGFA